MTDTLPSFSAASVSSPLPSSFKESEKLPLVTIGFLTYNNEDVLVRGLDSLVNQDYPNKEILIFDDCSTDNTYAICEQYAQKFPFIRLFRNAENVGCFKNLKKLIAQVSPSSNEFFLWACPDDVYAPTFLSRHVAYLQQHPDLAAALSTLECVFVGDDKFPEYANIPPRKEFWPLTNFSLKSFLSIGSRLKLGLKLLSYQHHQNILVLHGLLRTTHMNFLTQPPFFYGIEGLSIVPLFYKGGIGTFDDVLYTKYQSLVPLTLRHPAVAPFYFSFSSKYKSVRAFWGYIWREPFSLLHKMELTLIGILALIREVLIVTKLHKVLSPVFTFYHQTKGFLCGTPQKL